MSRRALLVSAATAFAVFVSLAVLVAARWAPLDTVDTSVVAAVHRFAVAHGWLPAVSRVVTDLGSPVAVDIVAVVAAIAFTVARRVADAVIVVMARLGELGIETLGKVVVGRARPVFAHPLAVAGGSSFPSGHTAGSAALYGTLVLLCVPLLARRVLVWVAVVAGVFVLAVGVSRVVLGVHYPGDVVGGLALGLAWAAGTVGVVGARSRMVLDRVVHGTTVRGACDEHDIECPARGAAPGDQQAGPDAGPVRRRLLRRGVSGRRVAGVTGRVRRPEH